MKHSFNPFQVLYAIDSEHKIRVDAVHMGNLSRYMRRSCQANCALSHAFDTNGEIHLLVRARSDITKGQELTLPFDLEQEDVVPALTKDTHGFFVCNCQRDKCPLREALHKGEKLAKKAASDNEVHSQALKVETKVEANQEGATTNTVAANATATATNADLVKKKSPGVKRAEKKQQQQQQSVGHEEHDELNKSLSREDRKLMSYVRVIERLERQGERKKELRQQKADQKAAKAAAAAAAKQQQQQQQGETNSTKVEHDKENNHKENGKAGSGKKVITSADSSNKETTSAANQADKEIESIIKADGTKVATVVQDAAPTTAPGNPSSPSTSSDKVKSPDFSFVDVSVRPRQTLNLIQRNLSSPTYSGSSLVPMESMPSAMEPQTALPALATDSTASNTFGQSFNKALFNPKKRWLKCSEEDSPPYPQPQPLTPTPTSTPSTPYPQATLASTSSCESTTVVAQPPKKRRHMFSDSDIPTNGLDDTSNESFPANNLSRSFTDSPSSQQQLLNINVSPTSATNGMSQTTNTPPGISATGYSNFNHLTPSTPQLLTPNQPAPPHFPYPSALDQQHQQQAFFDQQNLLINQTLCYLHQQQQQINNEINGALNNNHVEILSTPLSCSTSAVPLPATTITTLPLLGHFPALDSPTSQAATPEQQHSPSSSQDANKNKSKKVSLTEYLQRKKNEKKAEPKASASRQNTRENSVDSASSEMTAMTEVTTSMAENSVAESTEEDNKSPAIVAQEPIKDIKVEENDSSLATFLDKESTVEVVESGKSKVNQLLTSLMAKNKQNQQQQQKKTTSNTFDFVSSPINTGIDLFAKRSLFNNTTTTKTTTTATLTSQMTTTVAEDASPSKEQTQSKAEAGEIEDEPDLPIVKQETQKDVKSRSSSANSCHRSRKSNLSEPNSRSSSSNSSASSSVSNSLTGASSSVDSRSSRSSSTKTKKVKATSKVALSSSERQKQRKHTDRSSDRDRVSKQREKRRARSSSEASRHGKHQKRSIDSKGSSQASLHQESNNRTKSSSRRADSEVAVKTSKHSMSSSSQSSMGSSHSGHEYNNSKYSSKTHSRHSSEFERTSEHRRKKASHNSDDESVSMTRSRRSGDWEDMNERRTSRAPEYGRQFSSHFNGSSSSSTSQRDQRPSSYRSSYNEPPYSEFMARSRNRSKDRDAMSFSGNGPSMMSQKFYHSKSSPYPARLTDDYSYHHQSSSSSSHNDMYRGSSNRPYSSSSSSGSSKYYSSDKAAPRMSSSSSASAGGSSNKFDLRHQLNKTYYASQYEDRRANANENAAEADIRSDSEDSRKSSRTSPMNGAQQQRGQQRSIPHAGKSSGGANRVDPKSVD